MRYSILLLSATLFTASAQVLSFGLKGGIPLGDPVRANYFGSLGLSYVDTGRWTVGPTAELRLPFQFALEADALFRTYRLGSASTYQLTADLQPVFTVSKQDAKVWDIPLLVKYRLPGKLMRPFITAGDVLSRVSTETTAAQTCFAGSPCLPFNAAQWTANTFSYKTWRHGFTGGLGAEYTVKRIKIAPELRYMNQANPRSDQFSILVGVTF
jgi:hypothetical protein